MWIRSQNRTRLVKAEMVEAVDTRIFTSATPETMISKGICMGTYKTKERAMQVLNDIHGFIDCDGKMNNCELKVFGMPEE